MSGSLTTRTVVASMIWIACALGAGGWTIDNVFRNSISRQFDASLKSELDLLTARIADSDADPAGQMSNPDYLRAYSGAYWQADADDGRAYRSRSLWDTELDVPAALAGDGRMTAIGPDAQSVRTMSRTVTMPDETTWELAVGRDNAPLRQEISTFRQTLFLSAAVLGLCLLAAAFLLLRSALSPLRRLHRAVRDREPGPGWIGGPYPKEVAPLVEDLNRMIERNERLRERGRLQAANLAHALKTPTAILANELNKAGRGEPMDTALSATAVDNITAVSERHLGQLHSNAEENCEEAPVDVVPVAKDVVRAIRRLYPDKQLTLRTNNQMPVVAAKSDVIEILGNVVDNAAKWASQRVVIRLEIGPSAGAIVVEDDGTGVPECQHAQIFEQGVRLDESRSGSGLGLTIVADIVERLHGRIHVDRSLLGGLKVRVDLPT